MRFTSLSIERLKLPAGKVDHIEFDDSFPGFGIRLRDGGSRTWLYQYKIGSKSRRMALGNATAIPLKRARELAGELQARVRLGKDPQGEKIETRSRADESFAHARKLYLARRIRDMRPRSWEELSRHLTTHCRQLDGMALQSIQRRHVAERLTSIAEESGPIAANRVRASLSALFNWACREGWIETNPAAHTNRQPEQARDRVLGDDELRQLWRACDALEAPYGQFIKLLALTGQRRNEISGMRWSEIDLAKAVWMIPPTRTKNKLRHVVPLSPAAVDVIASLPRVDGSDFVLTLTGRVALNSAAAIKRSLPALDRPWTFHDLRRSASTSMADLGVEPHHIEAVLNHISGSKRGVAGVYNRARYDAEKRRALDLWADHLMALVEGRSSNVIALAR